VTPMCGRDLWQILVTSPEILIFALFMIPDPRTVPDGPVARVVFGVAVAMLSVLLLGPTTLEFWTKTAILASLVIACALRFALVSFLAPFESEEGGLQWLFERFRWQVPAAIAIAVVGMGAVPVAADLSTHSPEPAAGLADGSIPTVTLTVGNGPATAAWVADTAGTSLPPAGNLGPVSASARVWILPSIPSVSIASNVTAFNPGMTEQAAATMARNAVLDLVIESEARRAHDLKLAESGAIGDGLQEFVDVINQDIAAGKIIQKTYSFDQVSLRLYLPKFSSQAARLVGVSLHGTTTYTTRDASGNVLSQTSAPYAKSWGVVSAKDGSDPVIINDYTDLAAAP
jgi:hypothetical protein